MTAIFYPDCEAASADGQFVLEARSPHNGTINHRNGKPPSEDEFPFEYRQHQSQFRYRLLNTHRKSILATRENADTSVVWERWQNNSEDSPHELVVSDEGWSILRTHGFNPELIVVSPKGQDVLRVSIAGPTESDENASEEEGSLTKHDGLRREIWHADHFQCSTAGNYWTAHSHRYFLKGVTGDYFVWRTWNGKRLVIDLRGASSTDDASLDAAILHAEVTWAEKTLLELSAQATEIQRIVSRLDAKSVEDETRDPLREKLAAATAAIHLVGVHGIAMCIPNLGVLEKIDWPSCSTGSSAMRDHWIEIQALRPIIHYSLRLLESASAGYPAYHFKKDGVRFPIPECVTDRIEKAKSLNPEMTAEQVLKMLGSPDHVQRESEKVGSFYRWSDNWEYDFCTAKHWDILRIVWEEQNKRGRILRIEHVQPTSLHLEKRVEEIFRL